MVKNVLVVDDQPEILQSIKLALKEYESQLNVLVAKDGEEAISILAKMPVAVLVTDLYMPKVDGLELLAYMSQHHPETPCIVMTGFISPGVMEILGNLGIYRFLEKPFDSADLIQGITDAIKQIGRGKPVEHLSISNFLRLLEEEQRSCTLETISQKGLSGYFYLVDGRLYDAKCGNLKGEEAAKSILGWKKVSFNLKTLPSEDIKAVIPLSINALVAKVAGIEKENEKIAEKVIDKEKYTEILFQAIRSAESGQGKQAHDALAKILKINAKNSKAWLWFARTADNFKIINAALKNASIIAPNDSEITGENLKIKNALESGCEESSKLEHCPFCWAPVVKEHAVCHYCHVHLDIREDLFQSTFFASEKAPDPKKIAEAFQRLTKAIILEPKNVKAHFFLALAHINLSQWDEALDELKKAKNIAPDNNPYQAQLEIMADFMVNRDSFLEQDKAKEAIGATAKEPVKKNKSIMVVEDSTTTRTVIMKMLKTEGYNVIEASDGVNAITKFREKAPDLILLDIIMPGLDGYQTLATLKKEHDLKNIPVIMLTAKDSLLDKFKGKRSGSTAYLTKPFNSLDLIKKIREHLH
ncbi:MAG: response regulator [Desulfobulbaceae bacterium]|nr:response regulator [Desulfobulbaceae bacterium]